jgi:hypothetical protein
MLNDHRNCGKSRLVIGNCTLMGSLIHSEGFVGPYEISEIFTISSYLFADDPRPCGDFCSLNLISVQCLQILDVKLFRFHINTGAQVYIMVIFSTKITYFTLCVFCITVCAKTTLWEIPWWEKSNSKAISSLVQLTFLLEYSYGFSYNL